jgi:hypothetical protein
MASADVYFKLKVDNKLLRVENEKLKYRIKHLLRTVEEAEKKAN